MVIKRKYILKIAGRMLFALLFLFIASGFFVFFKTQHYLNKNLPHLVAEKSDNLYRLSFSKIRLKIFPLSGIITDVVVNPDENITKELLINSPGSTFYSFQSPEIKISGIGIFPLLKNKTFYCKNITVVKPVLKLSGGEILQNDSIQDFEKLFLKLRPLFAGYVKEINIETIDFLDANYGFYNSLGDSAQVSRARQVSVAIKKFRTDSMLIFGNNQLFDSEDILIRMNHFRNDMGDSLHVLNIDTVEYSLKTSVIHAAGFRLFHTTKKSEKNLYEVYVPRLYMKSKSITRFALKDSLKVQYLEFEKPQIRFFQKENPEQINIKDINNFNLYTLVEKQFKDIEIDSFYLSEANLEIFRQPDFTNYQQRFESVNITLLGFALDSASSRNPKKLLHADNLEMSVSGYHLRLEDKQHDFRASSMFVSTVSNSLGAKKITILPEDPEGIDSRTVVNINCEAMNIEEVNLKILYHTRKLPTQKIEITEPRVHLQYHTEKPKPKNQMETGLLFELVSAYLEGVYSEKVVIDKGVLNIENLERNKVQGYFETGFDFTLTGFSLDSASIKQTDKFFYADDFDLEFSDYQMRLVDDLHKINVDQISILSSDRKIQIENLHLQPIIEKATDSLMNRFNRSELYNIFVPRVTLWGINLRNAFFNNKLNITKFEISTPKIHVEIFNALRNTQDKMEMTELYPLIFNYISDFNVREINITNGSLTWVNHTKKGRTTSSDNEFSASLENFRLNEEELKKKRHFFSDNFDISVKDQMFQLSDSVHILQAGEINLSSANSSVSITNALLYPLITSKKYKQLATTFQVSLPLLQISNFDFQKAFYSKELTLARLEINAPRFQVYSQAGAAKSLDLNKFKFPLPLFIQSLQLNELKINLGEVITYETKGIDQLARANFMVDFSLSNIVVKNNEQNEAQWATTNLSAKITGYNSPLGKKHDLKIGQIDFNRSQKTLSIVNLKVNPVLPGNIGNRFTISAPKMDFTAFDINMALNENHFIFDKINIVNPEITIEINDSVQGNKFEIAQNLDLFPYAEPYIDKIKVNQLNLTNVDLNFNWFKKELIDRKINLRFNDINIGENQAPGNLLNSKEFELSTTNLKTTGKNGFYEFIADSLVYNSAKHNIRLTNLKLNPLLNKEEFPRQTGFQTDFITAQVDYVELQGIDENLYIKEKILDAGLLKIGKTELDIFRNKRFPFNHNQRPPLPQDLIKDMEQQFVFDSVSLDPSYLKYSELMDISDEPGSIFFNNFAFNAGKISNIEEITNRHNDFIINASALLFNEASVSATIKFDLTDKNFTHKLNGTIGNMPLQTLNGMVEKAAPLSIESGQLNRFDFDITFTKKRAEGELYFGYDDFKISILEIGDEGVKKSKLASFWANNMMLNSKNPRGNNFLPETISYERDIERSVISYWWKAIFTGAKQTIGIKTEEPESK